MEKADILSTWTGDGSEDNPNHPSLQDTHAVSKWQDSTGTPAANLSPEPNAVVLYVEAETAVMDAIEADENYIILTREVIPQEIV